MKASLIEAESVHDDALFSEHRKQVVATLSSHGRVFLARGGTLKCSKANMRTSAW
jgi:uncharacterized protein (DUF1330 family)